MVTQGLRREEGQELVEYALVLPLLLLLLFGIIELAVLIMSYNTVANAAREGARFAVVRPNQGSIANVTETCDTAANPIIQVACSRALALDPAAIEVTTTQIAGLTPSVNVHVEYTVTLLTGAIVDAMGGTATFPMRVEATMRLE